MLAYVGVVRVRHGRVEAVGEEGQRPVVPDRVPGGEGGVQRPVHHPHLHPVGGLPLLQLSCRGNQINSSIAIAIAIYLTNIVSSQ